MSGSDDFLIDLENATKARNKLQSDLLEYQRLRDNKESTARIQAVMRGSVSDLAINIDSLIRTLAQYDDDPSKYRVTPKEIERRKLLVSALEDDLNNIDGKLSQMRSDAPVHAPTPNFARTDMGENETTRNMSNSHLAQEQANQMRRQKETEEQILGVTENLVNTAKGIGDEVDLHNQLLDGVEANVDHTQVKLDKTTYKVQLLIYKSNDCCLIGCVCMLIALLLVLIFAT